MNYLALVNRARVECGVGGASTPLTTAQNLTGESARIAAWVNSAWMDIQTAKDDWEFMRFGFQFNTTAQVQIYKSTDAAVALPLFSNWKRDSFRCSTLGQAYKDEQLMNYMDYNTFRNLYQYGNMRTTYARPVVVSVTPEKYLGFGSIPDAAYVIVGEYYTTPVPMSADADTPLLFDRFHMMIVYRAMTFYGSYEAAAEVVDRGTKEFTRLMNRLDIDGLPTITSGPPLA